MEQFLSENFSVIVIGAVTVAIVAAVTYLTSSNHKPLVPSVDLSNQSVIIDGKPEHRASWLAHAPDYLTFDRMWPDLQTVYQVLKQGKKLSNNGPCLGSRTGAHKEYQWLSYQEVTDRVEQFGSGLIALGIKPANDSFVGIYAANRVEWTIADFGCQAYSMCPVPLYDTLGLDGCKYILNQCEMKVVVVDSEQKLQTIIKLKPVVASLELIVVVEDFTADLKTSASSQGLKLIQFYELLEMGKKNFKQPVPPKPTDMFSISYTSGTTGDPKGVMMTHKAYMLMSDSVLTQMKSHKVFTPADVHLSYLPLAHAFDRTTCVLMLLSGARIGYYSRDVTMLMDDFAVLRPTFFPSVPRLFNRLYDTVMADVKQSKLKTLLLNWALASKSREVDRLIIRKDSFWDKILFKKIQNRLGGRVSLVISGSAPLSTDVLQFLRCAFGCPVLEGYGQTESGAALTLSIMGDPSVGSVGPPLPGCHIKLVDIPDMNYFAKDNIGEVCAKGGILLDGYFKQPDKTAEAIDSEGWLHTGDVGTWQSNGTLKIVDRKKHIFKLSQGEYIAPEKIENVYRSSPFVAQCFVDGDSLKANVMAVVVPDSIYLNKWAAQHNFPTDLAAFCQHKDSHDLLMKDILECGRRAGLRGFEQVKDIILEPDMFSVENGFLTPTLKNKRPALHAAYQKQLSALYKQHDL